MQDLDGHLPAEAGVIRQVNFAHSAFAQLGEDLVRADSVLQASSSPRLGYGETSP